ncbi:MAG: TIM barrel protein [Clostridia bacterium]|nr:TIM barrel protein [Clostridia bacterium]
MYNFCIKADQSLAESFENQIHACGRLLINNIETDDRIDGEPLFAMSGKTIEQYRRLLVQFNKKIVLLDCSAPLADAEQYRQAFRKAHLLGVENIRVEPGAAAEGPDPGSLPAGLAEILKIGRSYGIGVVLENGRGSRLDGGKPIAALLRQASAAQPGLIFNPLEFAATGRHPFFHVFYSCRWKSNIGFLRVNDGLFRDGSQVMPGQGNAEIKEMASALLARSFRGYFSFCPYLAGMNEDAYGEVIDRFKALLLAM